MEFLKCWLWFSICPKLAKNLFLSLTTNSSITKSHFLGWWSPLVSLEHAHDWINYICWPLFLCLTSLSAVGHTPLGPLSSSVNLLLDGRFYNWKSWTKLVEILGASESWASSQPFGIKKRLTFRKLIKLQAKMIKLTPNYCLMLKLVWYLVVEALLKFQWYSLCAPNIFGGLQFCAP